MHHLPDRFYCRHAITPQLLLALSPIMVECFNAPPWNEKWTEASAFEELTGECSVPSVQVAIVDHGVMPDSLQPVGFALGMALCDYLGSPDLVERGADPESYYVAEVATLGTCRGQGIATRNLTRLIADARAAGFRSIVSRTRFDNCPMIEIFRRLGFVEICRYETETGGVVSERVVFQLTGD